MDQHCVGKLRGIRGHGFVSRLHRYLSDVFLRISLKLIRCS